MKVLGRAASSLFSRLLLKTRKPDERNIRCLEDQKQGVREIVATVILFIHVIISLNRHLLNAYYIWQRKYRN